MKEKIKQYIEDNFLIEFGDDINEETDLFKNGVFDSHGYIKLLQFLEQEFKIKFSEEEMFNNILVSLSSINDFINKK